MATSIGTRIAVTIMNRRGALLGHSVELIAGDAQSKSDAQSKPDVAINVAERLLDQENLDALLSLCASAQAAPLSARTDEQNRVLRVAVALPSAAVRTRSLR